MALVGSLRVRLRRLFGRLLRRARRRLRSREAAVRRRPAADGDAAARRTTLAAGFADQLAGALLAVSGKQSAEVRC